MKAFKGFLQKIDVFAVPLTFRYKEKNYYSTSLGGIFIILFLIVILIVGIYYALPFINRKNFTIVYYTHNLSKTEQINFKNSNSNFAYGLECGKIINGLSVEDVLKLESRYVIYKKNSEGKINKEQYDLKTHSCRYEDFYYKYNDAVDYLKLAQLQCLDDNSQTIEGIYSDQVFSYYEFAAVAKDGTEENYNNINNFLLENDCKFQFYYTDITFDLVNYKEPVTQYINQLFIQFDLTLFIKRNIFFMNQYLYNDDYLIWNFGENDEPDTKVLFSRYEEYSMYIGTNRTYLKRTDRDNYARLYIRADTKRTEITRRYQKLMEFYADISSMMVAFYRIMISVFNYINTFYAMHSVAKRIFFFRDIEKKRHYNFFSKTKNIYELIDLTEIYSNNNNNHEEESFETELKNVNFNKKTENKKNYEKIEKQNINTKNDNNNNNNKNNNNNNKNYNNNNNNKIYNTNKNNNKTYNNNKTNNDKNNSNNKNKIFKKNNPPPKNSIHYKNRKIYQRKEMSSIQSKMLQSKNDNIDKVIQVNSIDKKKGPESNEYLNMNKNISYGKDDNIYNLKSNYINKMKMNNSDRTKIEEPPRKRQRHKKINYSFNIIETILVSFFYCCLPKNLGKKNNINEKANSIIFKKLDIVSYVRSMILFDLLNNIMLNKNKITILNFLSRPTISLIRDIKYPVLQFYQNYTKKSKKRN